MRKEIAIFINVRRKSRRCPDKLLKSFAGTTLIDILLDKIKEVDSYPIYFAAYEEEFIEKAKNFKNIKIIKRSLESAEENSVASKIFEALNYIPSEYVAWINPCHPFLRIETFLSSIEFFKDKRPVSLTSVKKKKGWFYTPAGEPITNKDKLEVDTVLSDWIYEVAHAFHIYPREFMIKYSKPWTNTVNDPYLFEISELEALDIDTEEDFCMIEFLYQRLKKGV